MRSRAASEGAAISALGDPRDALRATAFERVAAPLVLLTPDGELADANASARDLLSLPRAPGEAPALPRATLSERLGVSEAALSDALRRAAGQDGPTPLGLRPPRAGNLDVLRASVEALRDGRTVRGHLVAAPRPSDGLRGFARLSDELVARNRELASERAATQALQAERDRARVVAEVIAEDIGAPAGRIASRLGILLRAPGLIASEAARQAIESVAEEVWRLLDTVASVLEHGAREPVAIAGEPVDLVACCGEALSRLRPEGAAAPPPICALGAVAQVRGDWRLTPLLLQRCFAYAGLRAPENAQLAAHAAPRRPGGPLTIGFSAAGAAAPGERGAALLLALRDLARAHGWDVAPAFGDGAALTLTIPGDQVIEQRSEGRARGVAQPGAAG